MNIDYIYSYNLCVYESLYTPTYQLLICIYTHDWPPFKDQTNSIFLQVLHINDINYSIIMYNCLVTRAVTLIDKWRNYLNHGDNYKLAVKLGKWSPHIYLMGINIYSISINFMWVEQHLNIPVWKLGLVLLNLIRPEVMQT